MFIQFHVPCVYIMYSKHFYRSVWQFKMSKNLEVGIPLLLIYDEEMQNVHFLFPSKPQHLE